MKKILSILVMTLTALAASAATYTPGEVPNVQKADSTRFVSNPDGILSQEAEARINATLLGIRRQTTAEVVLVVVDNIDPEDIDTFATDLFGLWGIGKKDKDNGALIVVAKDIRRYVIRTGYGVEGILPDVLCARIERNILNPAFRAGDFDGGLEEATSRMAEIMEDPAVRDELLSEQKGYGNSEPVSWTDIFMSYFWLALIVSIIVGFTVGYKVVQTNGQDRHDRYQALRRWQPITGALAFFTLGMTALIYFPLKMTLNKWRNGTHLCPNCGTKMVKLDEEHDNEKLTPAQDTEEKINSVDYDVWECPNCGETDIYAFNNPNSTYTVCEFCGARACRPTRDRVIQQPTASREGYGVHESQCLNCHQINQRKYRIAKLATATPIIIGGLGGRGGGGGFGGFGGGGFGGGMTGGGGASGGW